MSLRTRFSLKAVFIVSTAVALFLGFVQWRRQAILREIELFQADGVHFAATGNAIWPTFPRFAGMDFTLVKPGLFSVVEKPYTLKEMKAHYYKMERRLKSRGVKTPLAMAIHLPHSTILLNSVDDLDNY